MAIKMRCNCGRALLAPENFAGASGYCPSCGQMVVVPPETAVDDEAAFRDVEALPIREFLDPPRETLFESNAAIPTPAARPMTLATSPTMIASAITERRNWAGSAPMARRSPISRTRWPSTMANVL